MKKLTTLGLALGAAIVFAGTAQAQIKMGVAGPLTGPNAAFGAQLKNGTDQADFYDGVFKIGQAKKSKLTTLTLVGKLSCGGGKASAAAKKKKSRRLWGDGRGRFRTKGKHSAATVVGTKWLVKDTCSTTTTQVARGKVSVRDFAKRKTVVVKAGHKYVAKGR